MATPVASVVTTADPDVALTPRPGVAKLTPTPGTGLLLDSPPLARLVSLVSAGWGATPAVPTAGGANIENTPLAPLAGAKNVTLTPGTGLLNESFTVA